MEHWTPKQSAYKNVALCKNSKTINLLMNSTSTDYKCLNETDTAEGFSKCGSFFHSFLLKASFLPLSFLETHSERLAVGQKCQLSSEDEHCSSRKLRSSVGTIASYASIWVEGSLAAVDKLNDSNFK